MSSDEDDKKKTRTVVESSSSINIPYPPFWDEMPEIWFAQMENIFKIKKIKSDEQQYLHTVASLPVVIIASISDVIQKLPEEHKYDALKTTIIKRKTLSENQRLEKLLESTHMGDRSPSQFWRDLKSIAGESLLTNDSLVKNLWFKRLPEKIQPIVISRSKDDMAELIELADSIWQISYGSGTAISEIKTENSALSKLESEISELRAQIKKFHTYNGTYKRNRSRSRTKNHGNPNNGNRNYSNNKTCFYHNKFGAKAKKCKGGKCPFFVPEANAQGN